MDSDEWCGCPNGSYSEAIIYFPNGGIHAIEDTVCFSGLLPENERISCLIEGAYGDNLVRAVRKIAGKSLGHSGKKIWWDGLFSAKR